MFIKTKYTGLYNIKPNHPYYVEHKKKDGCSITSDINSHLYVLLGMSKCAHLPAGYEWEVCVTGLPKGGGSNE